ncbi:MAG: Polyprenyl synthetase [uncultured bacterium]|nr:MAG: Polyprenyl synthetase [uncultured bacterium]
MIQKTLEETKKLVWPVIEKYLSDPRYPKQFQIPKKFKMDADKFWEINKVYPERKGKYLRPTLVKLIANAFGANSKNVLQIAGAMQLSEEWILISDDIEDNSDERRGKPTLHKMYGVELAINASDSIETIMWKMIVDSKNSEIIDEFYRMLTRTTLGQGVEQIWTNSKKKIDNDSYFFVADSKSAYYSIAGPMRLGAILAKATDKQLDKITEFGLHLGRCFQLVDDILDLEQDKKEGKSTLVTEFGTKYSKKLAVKESNIAKKIFGEELEFLSHEPARTKLVELLDFILERDY